MHQLQEDGISLTTSNGAAEEALANRLWSQPCACEELPYSGVKGGGEDKQRDAEASEDDTEGHCGQACDKAPVDRSAATSVSSSAAALLNTGSLLL